MKISYNWLKRYVNFDLTPEKTAELLTDCGLEVEAVTKQESIKGGLQHVLIGKVLTCDPHPDSDHLHVTTVDVGKEEPLNIVCGAANVAAGQTVVVATIGAVLTPINSDESFQIKKSKLRGVVSEGMICAEDEIGVGNSHEGIMVLPDNIVPGTEAKTYFNLPDDYIFEIGLTPNRSDAVSHIGVARDLAALLRLKGIVPDAKLNMPSVADFRPDEQSKHVDIEIADPTLCPRYSGVIVSGVTVKESPEWLKTCLRAIDIRPINNVVDISNFIVHEMGQPLHTFDLSKIDGNKVIIKRLPEGTPFVTLDEVERKLSADDLMICNANEPMCIAGVFGGTKSGITEQTTDVFIESAYFNPVSVRKTSKRHTLKTDASFRFERGCDPEITTYAAKRAALLIKEICGGKIVSDIIDVYPKHIERAIVEVNYNHINTLIGKNITPQEVKDILTAIEIEIVAETQEGLTLRIPTNKVDVTREADVIEEILRIYGYNNVEIPDTFIYKNSSQQVNVFEQKKEMISTFLSSNGFYETMNNSLTKSEYFEKFSFLDEEKRVAILNPLSRELNSMRQSLLLCGLENIAFNSKHKLCDLKLYEFGIEYLLNKAEDGNDITKRYTERNRLAVFVTGKAQRENWNVKPTNNDFFALKNYVHNIFRKMGMKVEQMEVAEVANEAFAFGLEYKLNGKTMVTFGGVAKKVLKYFDINQEVFAADFDWDAMLRATAKNRTLFAEINRFPEVRRDLALVVDKSVKFADLKKAAMKAERKLLKEVGLFDVYEGNKIESGKKSYAMSFIIQHSERTLTDAEINKVMDNLVAIFAKNFNATLR